MDIAVDPLPAIDWIRIGETTVFSPALNFTSDEHEVVFREGQLVCRTDLRARGDLGSWVMAISPDVWQGRYGQGQSCRLVVELVVPEIGRAISGGGAELLIHENGEDSSLFFTISAGANNRLLTVARRYGRRQMELHSEPAPRGAHTPGAHITLEMQYVRNRGRQDATVFFLRNGSQLNYVSPAPSGPSVTVAPRMVVVGSGEFRFISIAVYMYVVSTLLVLLHFRRIDSDESRWAT